MKETVLITGGKGMVAKHLSKLLEKDYEIRFLTRNPKNQNDYEWNIETGFIDAKALKDANHIIHLAGAGIADKPWSKKRKELIYSSRIKSAELIKTTLENNGIKINTFISASAIGFYGTETTETIFTEEIPNGNDFLSNVCFEWENAAKSFEINNLANRVSIIRIGVVLSNDGGALTKIIQPIKYGLGAALGNGNQWMPWIHITDLSRMFKLILENNTINGVYNGVAPEHITNKELTKKIAKFLSKKIILPNIPAAVVRLIFGKRAMILLEGSRVSCDKIINTGFTYKFNTIDEALNNIIKGE